MRPYVSIRLFRMWSFDAQLFIDANKNNVCVHGVAE